VGRTLAATPLSSSAYLATEALLLAATPQQRERYLPRLALGEWIGCLALAEGPQPLLSTKPRTRADGGRITGVKLPVADGEVATFAVVSARESDSQSLYLVDLATREVSREKLATVDPTRSHARVVFEAAPGEPLGAPGSGAALLRQLFDRAAILFAFEQVGGAQASLDMARDYALGRFAFGRPIGSFQAIKHKLAEVYIATELARSNAYYGAWALSTNARELPIAAAAARISASEAFFLAAKENIQTHGGMGFTWEFDCHMYYRRAKLLSLALGSPRWWKHELIARIEAAGAA
jgi:alkylation response protein AidB-like acyl-CoA dehydrogenase